MKEPLTIFWFRRDLRIEDNAALWAALKSGKPVLPIFIFDRAILDKLTNKRDARLVFIHREINSLKEKLERNGSSLRSFYGNPIDVFKQIIEDYNVSEVYVNRDYEPYAQLRDTAVYDLLSSLKISFKGAKDMVIFEKNEVIKDDGKPYTVFTPYSRKWKNLLTPFHLKSYPSEKYLSGLVRTNAFPLPSLEDMGFESFETDIPERVVNEELISHYELTRDFPSIKGTTRLSLHLRFGTVSIRSLCRIALKKNEKWLNELIWRDFYQMIIYNFPYSAVNSFKPAYDRIAWRNHAEEFQRWCDGKTGYPIVDAGMRELNTTGFMHNRVRMIVASFLTKHLLIDWRWGEHYFSSKLLDYDLASNVGGWQWAAGCGCDAAPYFRIFNPESQMKKFDPEQKYIRQWVPEYGTTSYPEPMVDHTFARNRCLSEFKRALIQ